MNKLTTKIWGKEIPLRIIFEQYNEDPVLSNQIQGLDCFVEEIDKLSEASLNALKNYCKSNDKSTGENIDNIFAYVKPYAIYVSRNEDVHEIALLCNFKLDPEHGVALVFRNEKFCKVGPEDIIL